MLEDAASAQGELSGISSDMAAAVSAGMKKSRNIMCSWTRKMHIT